MAALFTIAGLQHVACSTGQGSPALRLAYLVSPGALIRRPALGDLVAADPV